MITSNSNGDVISVQEILPKRITSNSLGEIDFELTDMIASRGFRVEPTEPDFIDTGIIIGAEILGPVLGSVLGPKGIIAGSALGNYISQRYRIAKGFQSDVGLGELATATAVGFVPVGKFANVGVGKKAAIRAAQGAGLATGELAGRTALDEKRAPTNEEIATTLLFGGVFGGTLGAAEAKWMTNNIGTEVSEGMTRADVVKKIGKDIEGANGVDNKKVGSPILEKMDTEGLSDIKDPEEVADKLLQATEVKLLDEVDTALENLAKRPPLEEGTKSFDTPTMERGALERFSQPSFGKGRILGDEASLQDAVKDMDRIQRSLDDQMLQDREIFDPLMKIKEQGTIRQTALDVQKLGDTEQILRIKERIKNLDHKLGKGKGAKKERARLNADLKRIYKRNGMNLLDLEDDMRAAQMAPTDPVVGMRDRPMKQADAMNKEEKLAEKYFGNNYEKYFSSAFGTGATALGGGIQFFSEDEESEIRKAGFEPLLIALLIAAGISPRVFKSIAKTKHFKRAEAKIKSNPTKAEPSFVKDQKIEQATSGIYVQPNILDKLKKDITELAGRVLTPISRQTKNLDRKLGTTLTATFRNLGLRKDILIADFSKRAFPFLKSMKKSLSDSEYERLFENLWFGDYESVKKIIDNKKLMHKVGPQLAETRKVLEEIRDYAREQGGFNVGYIEEYFPRLVKDPKEFRKFLDENPNFREEKNALENAISEYASQKKVNVSDLDEQEIGEVISRNLRSIPKAQSRVPGNFEARSIFGREKFALIKDAYESPERALDNYIRSTVDAVETRKFLGQVKKPKSETVGFKGSEDSSPSGDLGSRVNLDDNLASVIAKDFLKGKKFDNEDLEKLKEILQSSFSGGKESQWIRGLKNLSYIQTMTNFGSAITQLADNAFSIHFNGLGNHFKTIVERKNMFDFADAIGLSNREFENMTNTDKLTKVLDDLFKFTKLKQLDLFAKNAYMNAAWRKYHNMANQKGGSQKLADELRPYFGERTNTIVQKVRQNAPKNEKPPAEVTELVYHKLLDVSPASATEVPLAYMANPNFRIMYMLKTFTIKQFDAMRTAGLTDMKAGAKLYLEGRKDGDSSKQDQGARLAMKGLSNVVKVGSIFAAANATTDMIKDTIYGRPIKRDETFENNLWRLLGLSRYTYYTARREGIGSAAIDLIAPPVALFDRASKDIQAIVGDKEYKGAMLQGTPLDLIYWRHLGGLDKIERDK